jgi:ABC-2 type transport system permease protein
MLFSTLQMNSNFNVLLTTWLFLISFYLALIIRTQNKYPIPEALELTVKQRNAYHEKWDMDKQETLDKFYTH